MNILKYIRLLTKEQRRSLIPVFVLGLITSVLEVFGLGLLIPFFQFLMDGGESSTLPAPVVSMIEALPNADTPEAIAMWFGAALIGAFLVKSVVALLAQWVTSSTVFRLYRETAARVLANFLTAPISYLATQNSADTIRIVSSDTQQFFLGYVTPLLRLFAESLTIFAILIAMFIVDPIVTLVAAVSIGLIAGTLLTQFRRVIIKWGRRRRDSLGLIIRWVSQGLGAIKEVQVLRRQSYIVSEYSVAAKKFADAAAKHAVAMVVPRYVLEVVVVATLVGVVAILQAGDDPRAVWLPRLMFFGAASVRLIPSTTRSMNSINSVRANVAPAESIYESLIELPQQLSTWQEDSARKPIQFESRVSFDDVRFRYTNAESSALDGVSFEIAKGTTVAFVGPTGAGKTTAADVLLGLLRPETGELRVDGVSVRGNESSWQEFVGYVPQFIYLADLTIRENIALGVSNKDVDEDDVWNALKQASAQDFVRALPNGIDTRVGERGVMLSGGQRQRIGIARALYFKPQVLVLDEATSALDSETEASIADATARLSGDTTLVLIAHRITTVRHADRIIVMDHGHVVDSGTFDELMISSELFRGLARGVSSDTDKK